MNDGRLPLTDLVAAADIADKLGYAHPESVHKLHYRHKDFPKPVTKLGNVIVWSWADVREWAIKTGRLDPSEQ